LAENSLILDDIDKKIISFLKKNGRMSFKDIARQLKLSDGTIRFRTKRLIDNNILKISALINPFAFDTSIITLIGMKLEKRTHEKTMKIISKLKGVVSVINATGEFDLLVEVFTSSRKELNKFLIEDLFKIDGIQATETFVYLVAINKWIEMP
jgi:DNA-binding Lrp family transcriptional regulator